MNGLGLAFGRCAGGRAGTRDLLPTKSSEPHVCYELRV